MVRLVWSASASFLLTHTRIPLERGRDIALQYGVAPLLAPLFDFVPNANALGGLPAGLPNITSGQFIACVASMSSGLRGASVRLRSLCSRVRRGLLGLPSMLLPTGPEPQYSARSRTQKHAGTAVPA